MLTAVSLATGTRPRWVFNGFDAIHSFEFRERFQPTFEERAFLCERLRLVEREASGQDVTSERAALFAQLGAGHEAFVLYARPDPDPLSAALADLGWSLARTGAHRALYEPGACEVRVHTPPSFGDAAFARVSLRIEGAPLADGWAYRTLAEQVHADGVRARRALRVGGAHALHPDAAATCRARGHWLAGTVAMRSDAHRGRASALICVPYRGRLRYVFR